MNRFIIEVLPTDWSPKSTTLHFVVADDDYITCLNCISKSGVLNILRL